MSPLDLFIHLMGFMAPALGVALLVALAARVVMPRQATGRSWWSQTAINSIAGVSMLVLGLWYFGVDGKMASYAAMVFAVASAQWLGSRAWRG